MINTSKYETRILNASEATGHTTLIIQISKIWNGGGVNLRASVALQTFRSAAVCSAQPDLDASDVPESGLCSTIQLQRHCFPRAVMQSSLFQSCIVLLDRVSGCFISMVEYIYSTMIPLGIQWAEESCLVEFLLREKNIYGCSCFWNTPILGRLNTKYDWLCLNLRSAAAM